MTFAIEMGVPEMDEVWTSLLGKFDAGKLDEDEKRLLKKLRKTVLLLAENPGHPGLASHEISDLTKRIWNKGLAVVPRKPQAGRGSLVLGLWACPRRHYDYRARTSS